MSINMYRLLIVDDEPIIVNGLVDFFSQQEKWPLEVYGAYSGEEAMQLLLHMRFDIVITDIGMPEMDGLQLQKKVLSQWPRCKIIFLTGYNDFEYVQEALRHKGVDYVLKTEGDEAIVRAVELAIEYTREEVRKDQLMLQADRQLRLAVPALQKELLRNLVLGDYVSISRLSEQFNELMIPLHANQKVLMVLARIDTYKPNYSVYDRGLLAYAIQNVASEYLQDSVHMLSVEMEVSRMLWFIQPKPSEESGSEAGFMDEGNDERWVQSASFIQGNLESIQQTCKELLEVPISFVIESNPVSWTEAGQLYEKYNKMLSQGLGMGTELLLTSHSTLPESLPCPFQAGKLKKKLELLKLQLDGGQKEAFDSMYADMMKEVAQYKDEPRIRQEIYYSLVPIFLACMNRHMIYDFGPQLDISKLTHMESHSSWEAVTAYFHGLASAIFARTQVGLQLEEHAVVQKVHQYIHDHLDGDVSLVRIGEAVGHNSKYLSRVYKKITGEDLSHYIAQTKLSKAQALLKETQMKIYEVSAAVGFLAEPYFYRFFRKAAGITPQEYRDLHKVDKR
ncbi:response regulator [Paenibacillus eucommiae]|uniref:Two-component system response regulator YesN n=1 Tax=Paenibacillus eucommiae TaxID=1355755 RepID=A0ABS4IW35_9BACL|nr:response regulator [Paenibacillus eucommiae]MBP1991046.1 two-component system response regulator YesN [Paenibacillus eucommiae]